MAEYSEADLPSFFGGKTPGSLSYEELQQRRRLAYALATRNRPFPKTIGEGLTALGEAWGERGLSEDIARQAAAYGKDEAAARKKLFAGDPTDEAAPPVAPIPPAAGPPPVPAAPPVAPVAPPVPPGVVPPPGGAAPPPGGAAPMIPPAPAIPGRMPAPPARAEAPPPIIPGSVALGGIQPPPPPPGRDQMAVSLANGPSSDLASAEDARLADVTGQATPQPRVQVASLARNEPGTDVAPPPMGGAVDAGVAQAADARRDIALKLAEPDPATGLPVKVAQGPGPAPGSVVPGPVAPPVAPSPPLQIQGVPERPPRSAGPEPTPKSVLMADPVMAKKLLDLREVMTNPRFSGSPLAKQTEEAYKELRQQAHDIFKNKWTRWHELDMLEEKFIQGTEKRQQERETHAIAVAKAPPELLKLYQDLRQSGETHDVAMKRAPIEYEKLKDEVRRAEETHAQAIAKGQQELIKGKQELITEPTPPPAPGAPPDPRLGTVHSPQRTGVPNVPPVPAGLSPKEWSEKQAPEMVKAVSAYEKAAPSFNDMIKTLKLAREHPGNKWGTGVTAEMAGRIPATDAYGFKKIMDQIGGKNFLIAYGQLKGGGAITEIEGTKSEAAQARLARPQSKEDFKKSMDDFEEAVREDFETVQRKVNKPVTAWRPHGDNSSYAPDIGQTGMRGGKLKEYIGGNPARDESYREVRQ